MESKHYLCSFHGMDVGLIYNLPKNVKIFLYCYPGKPVDATDCNEASTWYMATRSDYDKKGKFMKDLKLTIGPKKYKNYKQYCVFSGDMGKYDLNRIPDLYFEDEDKDFRTGLFNLPAKFQRIFIKEKYSSIDKKLYKPGDKSDIDSNLLHNKLKPYTKKYKDLPESGFLSYFVEPGTLYGKKFKDIDFVVIPKSKSYFSYLELCKKTNKKIEKTKGIPNNLIKGDPIKIKNKEFRIGKKYKHDISVPNSKDSKEIKIINKIVKENKGLYLSDMVRFLCNKHKNTHITIVISACRVFHDDLPKNVMKRQMKTASISVDKYLNL